MENFFNKKVQPRRNAILWILAICAMIDAFTNGLSQLIFIAMPDLVAQSMEAVKTMPMFNTPEYAQALDAVLAIKGWQHSLLLLTEIAAFMGAFLMLVKLNPVGFHIYTIGQLCQIVVMNLCIGGASKQGVSAVLMMLLMVAIFASQLPFMQHGSDSENQTMEDSEAADESLDHSEESDTED